MLTDSGPADMVKVFISYSHDDKKYCDQIKKSLAQLQQCGKSIDVWADHEIKAGEEWDESIEEKLRQADIILFLVSISFIASPYIKDKELAVGYERREGGSAEIIPVLLSASMWEQTGLARFQALPIDPSDKRSKPIEDWDNKSQAYNSIALAIDDRASNILKNKQVREINEKLHFYKKKCQEFLSQSPDLELSIANQHSLDDLCEDLGIGKAEAEKAFEEAEKPFRVLKKNRERYLDTVKAYLSVGSDLSAAQTQNELKDRELALRLEDGDISALQPEIDRLTEEQRAKEEGERRNRDEEAKRSSGLMARDFETPPNLKAGLLINGQPGSTGQVPTRQADGSLAWQALGGAGAAKLIRIDTSSTANTIYVGKAPVDTSESAAGWTVKKTTFTALGVKLTEATAIGIGANRASLTYT